MHDTRYLLGLMLGYHACRKGSAGWTNAAGEDLACSSGGAALQHRGMRNLRLPLCSMMIGTVPGCLGHIKHRNPVSQIIPSLQLCMKLQTLLRELCMCVCGLDLGVFASPYLPQTHPREV